ncbi:DUF2911 domain-containing protein [Zunongwangia sp. F363]|uniref:DUF2911 domain-containing protein n=1 Tax=Autumnicola tepida TaxID=3075595 RepID=A0ABU3CDK4_9FLAO|nr:DUF2911 domain-containing protein [Zunongwangia sp. F363]MDT0644417.1 DUF2911 domain-containing protein [Zunongwangia sp. F363]
MKPVLKNALKLAGGIAVLSLIIVLILRYNTKAHSPEATVQYEDNGLKMEVFYNRPYKKGRNIFGGLVPYGEVWRTGANEATTFETHEDIMVDGSLLRAGKYTLWTIPGKNSWKVIFNSQMYPWGIDMDKKAYRNPQYDALVVEIGVDKLQENVEQFTIFFSKSNDLVFMILTWDHTSVPVPIKPAPPKVF